MAAPRIGASFFALPAQTRLFIQFQSFYPRPAATLFLNTTHLRYRTTSASRHNKNVRPVPSVKRAKLQSNVQPSTTTTTTTPIRTGPLSQSGSSQAESLILAEDAPVVLYEADKRLDRQFVGAARIGSLLVAGYGVALWKFAINHTIDTTWVNVVHYGLPGALILAGGYLWYGTCKNALKITAIPSSPSRTDPSRHVNLHIQGRGYIPFTTITEVFDCRNVTRDSDFLDKQEQWWEETERSRQRRPLSEIPPLIRPFEKFGRWCGQMVQATRYAFRKDHFNYLRQPGKPGHWKVDFRGNVLFDRKGLDMLLPPTE